MSNSNMNPRSSESQSSVLSRMDKNELKSIKVAITRRNVPEPNTSTTLLRSLDDPAQLVVHYRPDEGARPIFDREDIIVNKEDSQEERTILSSLITEPKASSSQAATSRSSSRSSRSSQERSPTKFLDKHTDRKRLSPQPHSSREEPPRDKDYYSSRHRRSSSNTRKAVYKTRKTPSPPSRSGYRPHRYSRSPPRYGRRTASPPVKDKPRPRERSPGYRSSDKDKSPQRYRSSAKPRSKSPYRGPPERRRSSRSPPSGHRGGSDRGRYSRSPHKYRGPPDRKRSRSPPPKRSSRGRSRSHSPYHSRRSRSRYSRSPHRHEDYRRYERAKRSRSPRRHSRYSPERHSRRSPHDEREYQGPKFPNPYFEGAEFWIPDPTMQPRFIPRHMIPPGAFPYGPPLRPGMPMMIPPRIPFRPRIVYNRPPRPRAPTVQAIESGTNTVTTATTVTTTAVTSSVNDETQHATDETETVKEPEHSSPNKTDNDKNT